MERRWTEAESEEIVREAHANINLPYESIRQVKAIAPADVA